MRFKNIVLLQTRSKTVMNGLKGREPAGREPIFEFWGQSIFNFMTKSEFIHFLCEE